MRIRNLNGEGRLRLGAVGRRGIALRDDRGRGQRNGDRRVFRRRVAGVKIIPGDVPRNDAGRRVDRNAVRSAFANAVSDASHIFRNGRGNGKGQGLARSYGLSGDRAPFRRDAFFFFVRRVRNVDIKVLRRRKPRSIGAAVGVEELFRRLDGDRPRLRLDVRTQEISGKVPDKRSGIGADRHIVRIITLERVNDLVRLAIRIVRGERHGKDNASRRGGNRHVVKDGRHVLIIRIDDGQFEALLGRAAEIVRDVGRRDDRAGDESYRERFRLFCRVGEVRLGGIPRNLSVVGNRHAGRLTAVKPVDNFHCRIGDGCGDVQLKPRTSNDGLIGDFGPHGEESDLGIKIGVVDIQRKRLSGGKSFGV